MGFQASASITGSSITIRQLAEQMVDVAGKNVLLESAPPRSGDVLFSQANTKRAQDVLGWRPEINLRDGLVELLHGNSSS